MPVNKDAQLVRELPEDGIQIPGMMQLDGQYLILVSDPKAVGDSKYRNLFTHLIKSG